MTFYLLKGYSISGHPDPIVTFESKAGPFYIGNGSVTSQTYDGKEVVWLRWDDASGNWCFDAVDLGFNEPHESRFTWIRYFTIEAKEGADLRIDQLDRIETRLIMIWNRLMRVSPTDQLAAELEALKEVHDEAVVLHTQAREMATT